MDAEYLLVYYGCQGQVIEDVSTVSPNIQRTIFSQALVVESINLSYLSAFVVASDESNEVGVSNFVGQKKEKGFNTVESSIYEISKKEVANSGYISSIFEELKKIVELPMDVSADGDRGVDSLNIAFLNKNLSGFGAEVLDLLFTDDLSFPKQLYLFV